MKLIAKGATSNGALAYHLMQADLKKISRELENTVAAPLVATQAAKMAESIRATFNTHANALRFLPDPVHGEEPFSINKWMIQDGEEGSILFITSNHNDLVLNGPLLTLWMDLAVNALFRLPRTRDLRTWFLLDEVHSLHKLPAIDHGLQTARAFATQAPHQHVLPRPKRTRRKHPRSTIPFKAIDRLTSNRRRPSGVGCCHCAE